MLPYDLKVLMQCLISTSWIVFINRKTRRIRGLKVFNNDLPKSQNKNNLLTRPRGVSRLNAYVSKYHTFEILINNFCHGKSQVQITRDVLFVLLRKKLDSLASRFQQVNCRYVQGGSIKHLLRFGGRFFRIEIWFENSSNMIVIYVILTLLRRGYNLQLLICTLLKYKEWLYNIIDDKKFEINSMKPQLYRGCEDSTYPTGICRNAKNENFDFFFFFFGFWLW